jgi:site-specific recombinase XerD
VDVDVDVVSRVRVSGPLAVHAAGFAGFLAELGYTPLSAVKQVRLLAHLSRWMEGRGLGSGELTGDRLGEFLAARREAGRACLLSERGLAPLLGFLRGLGVVPEPERAVPAGAVDVLLGRYRAYLEAERGLAAGTVRYCTDEARGFLAGREDRLEGLDAAEVSGFVAAECRRRSTGSAKILVTALRSLLRFLVLDGLVTPGLQDAVPAVAGWRGGGLPKALPDGQVDALLAACDRAAATGRRDFAVLTLLARLGLRAGEAAALELGDIDWRAGTVTVRGKGRREEQLPLPSDVGEALAGYLRDGRPAGGASRRAFLLSRAPGGGLSAGAVVQIVRRACLRAGLPAAGAHRLRHTAATGMLRAGAPLAEIGQVLRHRSAATTAIYAKVDHGALSQLAMPWPGALT